MTSMKRYLSSWSTRLSGRYGETEAESLSESVHEGRVTGTEMPEVGKVKKDEDHYYLLLYP